MHPQIQEPEIYDCLRTCVASIFDIERLDVLNFGYSAIEEGHEPGSDEYAHTQTNEYEKWFLDRGVATFSMLLNDKGLPRPMVPWGICIALGDGPRGLGHAVVWDAGWWKDQNSEYGVMIHDPHKSGDGLVKITMWSCFTSLQPPTLQPHKIKEGMWQLDRRVK